MCRSREVRGESDDRLPVPRKNVQWECLESSFLVTATGTGLVTGHISDLKIRLDDASTRGWAPTAFHLRSSSRLSGELRVTDMSNISLRNRI